jgi:N-acetylmuramoyl-L-alanine amidase
MKILIIPGHGGKDPGAVHPELSDETNEEEDFNLDVGLELARILRDRGHDVSLTRDRDLYVSPVDQLAMIRRIKPDCVIAIHCNANKNPDVHGIETFYRDAYDIELAGAVHESLVAVTGHADRGIHKDVDYLKRKLAVLSDLETPACLVEIGYITNEEEFEYIDQNYQTIAEAIADGIDAWAS